MTSILKRSSKTGAVLSVELFDGRARYLLAEMDGKGFKVKETGETEPEKLREILLGQREKITVRVAGHFQSGIHRVLEVPSAKRKLLDTIVSREMERLLGKRTCSSWVEIEEGTPVEAGKKVMAVGVEEEAAEKIFMLFRGTKHPVNLLLTYPAAIHSLLSAKGFLGETPCAFIDILEEKTYITVYKGVEIRVERHLGFGTSAFENDASKLVQSIFQTVLFHKHQHRGEDVGRIVVHSPLACERICASIKAELGKEAEALDFSQYVPESSSSGPTPAMVGLLLATAKHPLSLVPRIVRSERAFRRNIVMAGSICLLLAASLGMSYTRLHNKIQDLENAAASLRGEAKLRENRIGKSVDGLILHAVKNGQPDWARVLSELAYAVPEGIRLSSMKVGNNEGTWEAKAWGEVDINDERVALVKIMSMLNNIEKSPLFGTPTVERKIERGRIGFQLSFTVLQTESSKL